MAGLLKRIGKACQRKLQQKTQILYFLFLSYIRNYVQETYNRPCKELSQKMSSRNRID